MSKGSAPRPISVPQAEYDRRWDETFGRKPEGYMDTPDCGWPFCSCAVKCEKKGEGND